MIYVKRNQKVRFISFLSMLVLLAAVSFGMLGCAKEEATETASAESAGESYVVGISQFVSVPPLDNVREGFKDRLTELMEADGLKVEYDEKNASADVSQAQTIATTFVSKNVDLIYAIATPSAQTAKTAADNQIPVVFGAITDPADPATGLVDTYEKPGCNVTGASDKNPIHEQMALFQELYGDEPVKKLAMIHSAEANAMAQYKMVKEVCDEEGIILVDKVIASTPELQSQFQAIAADKDIQGIYIGADNLVMDAGGSFKNFNEEYTRLPIITPDGGTMKSYGGIAAFGYEYYSMGRTAGEMAYKILTGKAKAEDIPVYFQSADKMDLYLNEEAAEGIDFTIPQSLLDRCAAQ